MGGGAGSKLSVPALDGRVNIKIPPGTQSGQKLRVRGRGLPDRERRSRRPDGRHPDCRAGKNLRRREKIVGTTFARIEIQSANLTGIGGTSYTSPCFKRLEFHHDLKVARLTAVPFTPSLN